MMAPNWLGTCFIAMTIAAWSHAQDAPPASPNPDTKYSPYPEQNFPNRVFFGDTHLHTSYSTDAGMFGNTLGPDAAYRFAKGETVTSSTGVPARLHRPLDFLVVADHAENLGLAPLIEESDKRLLASEWGKQVHDLVKAGKPDEAYAMWGSAVSERKDPLTDIDGLVESMWHRITKAAEAHNNPGLFTALIGFEWTSSPDGSNLHRNVVFRDDKARADQVIPLSAYDSEDPEDLWRWMANYEEKVGGRVLAIPHNGNLSNGLMFDSVTLTGKQPLDRDYAERRRRWEPLYEVTQIKGDGETHPLLSPNDEFADFETWDKGSFGAAKERDMLPREYAREALKQGLAYQEKLGANPYRFGMIGSTDSHTSLATTGEDNFFGKATAMEPSSDEIRFEERITGYLPDPQGRDYAIRHYQASASGLAAVWARENTREALWDAMARREVYATTGTRPIVRVFGGFEFTKDDLVRSDFARHGYEKGVPMGGELERSDKAPTFLVRAMRDPDGANLDRIQVVKGWLDAGGKTHERIYDIAVSDGRKIGADGRAKKKVGNTVDVGNATYTNAIGAPFLQAWWKDPDFDGTQNAFYYVRVLEIPTPRWTTYDARFFGLKRPEDVPGSIQERAYTSPIWYTP
ncbi:DUF3604 domain-containing protein [Microbulbifer zhoushanensis]|uniref:DUF3604 domain-containing protein n=1 Tax=Microbulbifer zhoushanensis TaxID=2904254 RepID=UPI001F1CA0C3|nr:DUF3604 domain-containing protein [Microbulbifer zhoushanensis]